MSAEDEPFELLKLRAQLADANYWRQRWSDEVTATAARCQAYFERFGSIEGAPPPAVGLLERVRMLRDCWAGEGRRSAVDELDEVLAGNDPSNRAAAEAKFDRVRETLEDSDFNVTPMCSACGAEMAWVKQERVRCDGDCANEFVQRMLECVSCGGFTSYMAWFPIAATVRPSDRPGAVQTYRDAEPPNTKDEAPERKP